jgi:hypothetical protein
MSPEEARALIEGRLGRALAPEEEPAAAAVVEELGGLPLALELAAAHVADSVRWGELLDDLKQEIARLEALEPPGADEQEETTLKRLSVRSSFRSSLRRLSPERREQFAWLGVLREDTSLVPEMVTTLWGTGVREARDTFRYLRDKALLMRGVPRADGTPTYRLHDLMRDEALRLVRSPRAAWTDVGLSGRPRAGPRAGRQGLRTRSRFDPHDPAGPLFTDPGLAEQPRRSDPSGTAGTTGRCRRMDGRARPVELPGGVSEW